MNQLKKLIHETNKMRKSVHIFSEQDKMFLEIIIFYLKCLILLLHIFQALYQESKFIFNIIINTEIKQLILENLKCPLIAQNILKIVVVSRKL